MPGHLGEPSGDHRERGWLKPWARQQDGERIDIVPDGPATHESCLNWRCSSAHEGIVDTLIGPGQSLDEECGQLRLETGAIADLVNRMCLTLAGGPELVDQIGDAALFELT